MQWVNSAEDLANTDSYYLEGPDAPDPLGVASAEISDTLMANSEGRAEKVPVFLFLRPALNWQAVRTGLLQGLSAGEFTRFRSLRRSRSAETVWYGTMEPTRVGEAKILVKRLWNGYIKTRNDLNNWQIPVRGRAPPRQGRTEPTTAFSGKLVSWNIRTLAGRRGIVRHLLERENVAVLGLQETQRTAQQYPLRLSGYDVLEQVAPHPLGQSKRGMALIVKENLGATQVGMAHPNFMFVRVPQTNGAPGWIIGNVYLPGKQTGDRQSAMTLLQKAMQSLQTSYANHRLVLMGDFNGPRASVLNGLRDRRLGAVDFAGSDKTWHGCRKKVSWTCIDYFLVSDNARLDVTQCGVLRQWDDSDHWPVQIRVKLKETPLASTSTQRPRRKPLTPTQQTRFKTDHLWSELLQQRLRGSLKDEEFGDEVIRTTQLITDSCKMEKRDTAPRVGGRMLSREEKKLIRRKQQTFQAWIRCDDNDLGRKEAAKAE